MVNSPFPLVEVAVEAQSEEDQAALNIALALVASDDPSLRVSTDYESGQSILHGFDEEHLDATLEFLIRKRGVGLNVGAPQVAYRETITQRAEIDHTYIRTLGPKGHFARVRLLFEPGEPGSDFVFENTVVGSVTPKEFIPGVEKGLISAKEAGLIAGFPVIDFKATLVGGAFHNIDSSVLAFEIASRAAFKELREKGGPKLIEPIMAVEVLVPGECLGSVIGDLHNRRGTIQAQCVRGSSTVINALVPLANMFGYRKQLQSASQGFANFMMQFSHYDTVPLPSDDPPTFSPAIGMRA